MYQKSLIAQGMVILIFVVLHLITFKFGPHYEARYDSLVVRDFFRLVAEVFQNPLVGGLVHCGLGGAFLSFVSWSDLLSSIFRNQFFRIRKVV